MTSNTAKPFLCALLAWPGAVCLNVQGLLIAANQRDGSYAIGAADSSPMHSAPAWPPELTGTCGMRPIIRSIVLCRREWTAPRQSGNRI